MRVNNSILDKDGANSSRTIGKPIKQLTEASDLNYKTNKKEEGGKNFDKLTKNKVYEIRVIKIFATCFFIIFA